MSGAGDGTYNYIRDIADLKELISDKGVVAEASPTQIAWEKGMDKFYESHYSSALKYFGEVKTLYPQHSKVEEFIASAEKHIANGDDISEFPLWIVWVGLGVVLLGAGFGTFFIIHQAKRHKVYKAGVAQGALQPTDMTPGVRQTFVVTPSAPTVVAAGGPAAPYGPAPAAVPTASAPVAPTIPSAPSAFAAPPAQPITGTVAPEAPIVAPAATPVIAAPVAPVVTPIEVKSDVQPVVSSTEPQAFNPFDTPINTTPEVPTDSASNNNQPQA